MEFGLFSESGYRQNPVSADAFAEDLAEIIRGDRLGFCEAWIAEPNNVRVNTVTDANLMICQLAGLTKQIRLGPGIRSLPLLHPINIVREANMCDHLTRGRYMLGYGGTRMATMEQAHQRAYILERRKREVPIFLQSRIPPGGTIDDLTFDYMAESGYYWVGSPETVYQRIKDYYNECGGFGILLMPVGLPIATPRKRARSMTRFMEQVAPRLASLDPDHAAGAQNYRRPT